MMDRDPVLRLARGVEWRCHSVGEKKPLDDVLARPSHLRVLRALCGAGRRACWPAEIAERAGSSRAAVRGALLRLCDQQVVEPVVQWGARRSVPYRLNRDHPLTELLEELFRLELRLESVPVVSTGAGAAGAAVRDPMAERRGGRTSGCGGSATRRRRAAAGTWFPP